MSGDYRNDYNHKSRRNESAKRLYFTEKCCGTKSMDKVVRLRVFAP